MATRVFGFRADLKLSAWIENQAYLEGITEAQLLHRAVVCYRSSRHVRGRKRDDILFSELLLCSHYLYQLLADNHGEPRLQKSLPRARRLIKKQVRTILKSVYSDKEP